MSDTSNDADKKKDGYVRGIETFKKTDKDYKINYLTGEQGKLTILNEHVFRFYMSPTGDFLDYPIPQNPTDNAKITVKAVGDYGKDAFDKSKLEITEHHYIVHTNEIVITFHKKNGTFAVQDRRVNKDVLLELKPIHYSDKTTQTLSHNASEYFFGGGMQNGRFTHKGEIIHIANTNKWEDGDVTSPNPFFWSTHGYGILRNTWQSGHYNFGKKYQEKIEICHVGDYFDAFYFINSRPRDILRDYYELTGKSIFIPEYAFYEAHLNKFNRDYWVEVESNIKGAIRYEDGKYYKCYQPKDMDGKKGILESLNGEKNNYQFSARAMIDRYNTNDMPLGWFVPNDGYGAGYGQTDSLAGDIKNLQEFIEYANKKGIEVALWTESNLEPKDPKNPKKGERDLSKEVGVGVVALKCDVAWIGKGYSFGLSAVKHATKIYKDRVKSKVRPLIIMVDGWAGTQRYSGIWSGDQHGGKWEYIRFHIPTYIGAGLSGIPVIGSDLDGIFGGADKEVNIRDFQWKSFTPLQLNMDGWGSLPKTPFSFDKEATAINKAYLKLKSMMLPYNYTIGHEAINGLPMVRAMFLEFPKDIPAYTKDSQYQYMWGPYILVAPVYDKNVSYEKKMVRDGVFLPDSSQVWIDFFTGHKYQGGKIYNNVKAPLWKIPVFVKDGAIIPFVNANNNPFEVQRENRIFYFCPNGETKFEVYEDDGKSSAYLQGHHAKTAITCIGPKSNGIGDLHIIIHQTEGDYNNMKKERSTLLRIMASMRVDHIKAAFNGESVNLERVKTEDEFKARENVFYFDQRFFINPYLKDFIDDELFQKCILIKLKKTDVTKTEIQIKAGDYRNDSKVFGSIDNINPTLRAPSCFTAMDKEITQTSIILRWNMNEHAFYYEIERDGVIFSNIIGDACRFDGFKSESEHSFRIRSVNDKGVSKWSYRLTIRTEEDPNKNSVKEVLVSCDIPCQSNFEVSKLTDGIESSMWHTDMKRPDQANYRKGTFITLIFDLGDVYEIDNVNYVPREDRGDGTFLRVKYCYSVDLLHWGNDSAIISWTGDESSQYIMLGGTKMRYFKLTVLQSVGGYGSGRHVRFYKKLK